MTGLKSGDRNLVCTVNVTFVFTSPRTIFQMGQMPMEWTRPTESKRRIEYSSKVQMICLFSGPCTPYLCLNEATTPTRVAWKILKRLLPVSMLHLVHYHSSKRVLIEPSWWDGNWVYVVPAIVVFIVLVIGIGVVAFLVIRKKKKDSEKDPVSQSKLQKRETKRVEQVIMKECRVEIKRVAEFPGAMILVQLIEWIAARIEKAFHIYADQQVLEHEQIAAGYGLVVIEHARRFPPVGNEKPKVLYYRLNNLVMLYKNKYLPDGGGYVHKWPMPMNRMSDYHGNKIILGSAPIEQQCFTQSDAIRQEKVSSEYFNFHDW